MELLAPAGNFEAFIAAVSNGADAIYLGASSFGARAYAKNFTIDEIKTIVEYAHLRNIKIYVTMNTILFDSELSDAKAQVDKLAMLNVDGIICADLALINYITTTYENLEAHASTQMGIDDLYGTLFCKDLGMKRVVLAREVPIEKILEIKEKSKMQIEVFVHGALCVSYSGNCLMSGLIGFRSGNRGRCVGSCRKEYELIDEKNKVSYGSKYYLSMKDLNTIKNIHELNGVDSLKLEGRMKEANYVANIVSSYREVLDNKKANINNINFNLSKTFNRKFTDGYIFHEDKKDITNTTRPNHFGYEIGKVVDYNNGYYTVKLDKVLNQNDNIRIASSNVEVNTCVVKMYDQKKNLINSSDNICLLKLKEKLNVGDTVYKTRDRDFEDSLKKTYPKEFKRLPLSFFLTGHIGSKLEMTIGYENTYVTVTSPEPLEKASKNGLDIKKINDKLNRLNDTPYYLSFSDIQIDEQAFVPISLINHLRQDGIEKLNSIRLTFDCKKKEVINNKKISFSNTKIEITVFVRTKEQENAAKDLGIKTIYNEDNFIRRNESKYLDNSNLLLGGLGAIEYYKGQNKTLTSDYSLNIVNSEAVNILHNKGVNTVCLSHEINKQQINTLVDSYLNNNDGYPNLEMIVYGYIELMQTKYCPLKTEGLCGQCKKGEFYLKDKYASFRVLSQKDCTSIILNSKRLNLIDNLNEINGISKYRLQFSTENYEETKYIINNFIEALNGNHQDMHFNSDTDTRGHFNKEIL